jgi:hypothetical protein
VSRAVLIALTTATVVAPAALAAEPGNGWRSDQCDATKDGQVLAIVRRATKAEDEAATAAKAVDAAETRSEARTARDGAVKAKSSADAGGKDLQAYLDVPSTIPVNDRICAVQQIGRYEGASKTAAKAIEVADGKINTKAQIYVVPDSVVRGGLIGVAVFCMGAKATGFASDVIDFEPSSEHQDKNITSIGGLVKKDASVGSHTVSASCDGEQVTTTFTVTAAPPVDTKKPTADDVRRNGVIKPKGKIETGGGATAVVTV